MDIVLFSPQEEEEEEAVDHPVALLSPDVNEGNDRKQVKSLTNPSLVIPFSRKLSPTEQRNEKSLQLSSMTLGESVQLMVEEESFALRQILTQTHQLEKLIREMSSCLQRGGRVFYVGAGTSGRLGVMDAIECHSTFSTPLDSVQGVIAGGIQALHEPFDCAEETFDDGLNVIRDKNLTEKDVAIGLSASGQTPYLWGALYEAKHRGSFVSLVTFNPFLEFRESLHPDLTITLDVGPEVLTGSTRLKCGTTTKTILNILSTLTMVRIGKCYQNLMIGLNVCNSKLKERSVRIVSSLFPDIDREVIRRQLIINDYDVRKSIEDLIKGKGELESTEKKSNFWPSVDLERLNKNYYHFLKKDGNSDLDQVASLTDQ